MATSSPTQPSPMHAPETRARRCWSPATPLGSTVRPGSSAAARAPAAPVGLARGPAGTLGAPSTFNALCTHVPLVLVHPATSPMRFFVARLRATPPPISNPGERRLQELLPPPLHRERHQPLLPLLPEREQEPEEPEEVTLLLQRRPPLRRLLREQPPFERPPPLPQKQPLPRLEQLVERQVLEPLLQPWLRDLEHPRPRRDPLLAPQTPELPLVDPQPQLQELMERVRPLPRTPRLRPLLLQLEQQPQTLLEEPPPKRHLPAQPPQRFDQPPLPQQPQPLLEQPE